MQSLGHNTSLPLAFKMLFDCRLPIPIPAWLLFEPIAVAQNCCEIALCARGSRVLCVSLPLTTIPSTSSSDRSFSPTLFACEHADKLAARRLKRLHKC